MSWYQLIGSPYKMWKMLIMLQVYYWWFIEEYPPRNTRKICKTTKNVMCFFCMRYEYMINRVEVSSTQKKLFCFRRRYLFRTIFAYWFIDFGIHSFFHFFCFFFGFFSFFLISKVFIFFFPWSIDNINILIDHFG